MPMWFRRTKSTCAAKKVRATTSTAREARIRGLRLDEGVFTTRVKPFGALNDTGQVRSSSVSHSLTENRRFAVHGLRASIDSSIVINMRVFRLLVMRFSCASFVMPHGSLLGRQFLA